MGADHQDPQLSAPVGIVIGAAVVISLLRDCHLEGEFRRGEGPVGRRSRVGAHHFLEETHIVGRECWIVGCWIVGLMDVGLLNVGLLERESDVHSCAELWADWLGGKECA